MSNLPFVTSSSLTSTFVTMERTISLFSRKKLPANPNTGWVIVCLKLLGFERTGKRNAININPGVLYMGRKTKYVNSSNNCMYKHGE